MSISSTVLQGVTIRFHAAPEELKPHVGCFWVINALPGAVMRLVPDGTTSISFEQQYESEWVGYFRGPLLKSIELEFSSPATLIGVRLRPGVAFNLTGIPLHQIANQRIPLAAIGSSSDWTATQLATNAPEERIATLQRHLGQRLASTSVHPIVQGALAEIHAACGAISVVDVARRCGASERHLSRLMRDWIGYGPKRYAAIVRFQSTLKGMEQTPRIPAATIATETGYFDQAHMTADVARYAGATPGHLVEEAVSDFSKTHCDVPY